MGRGKGLGRVGRTVTGRNAEGERVEYSLGIGRGGDTIGRQINRLSPNYRPNNSTRRINIGR